MPMTFSSCVIYVYVGKTDYKTIICIRVLLCCYCMTDINIEMNNVYLFQPT
jgi:hypothetical protein